MSIFKGDEQPVITNTIIDQTGNQVSQAVETLPAGQEAHSLATQQILAFNQQLLLDPENLPPQVSQLGPRKLQRLAKDLSNPATLTYASRSLNNIGRNYKRDAQEIQQKVKSTETEITTALRKNGTPEETIAQVVQQTIQEKHGDDLQKMGSQMAQAAQFSKLGEEASHEFGVGQREQSDRLAQTADALAMIGDTFTGGFINRKRVRSDQAGIHNNIQQILNPQANS